METTKAEGAEDAEAAPSKRTSPTKKRGRPPKAKGKGKNVSTAVDGAEDVDEEEQDGMTNGVTGKQYWLMKAEQEDREEKLKDGSVVRILRDSCVYTT